MFVQLLKGVRRRRVRSCHTRLAARRSEVWRESEPNLLPLGVSAGLGGRRVCGCKHVEKMKCRFSPPLALDRACCYCWHRVLRILVPICILAATGR